MKAQVSLVTLYIKYDNRKHPTYLSCTFLGKPSQSEVKEKIMQHYHSDDSVKTVKVVDIERHTIETELTVENADLSIIEILKLEVYNYLGYENEFIL